MKDSLRTIFAMVALLAWALWFGALAAMFVIGTAMFARDRALAVQANPAMLILFERYQLILGAIALASLVAWRMAGGSVLVIALFVMLAIAAAGAIAAPLAITSKMEKLRLAGQSHSAEFRMLHGQSMMVYSAEGGALLAAGLLLPAAIIRSAAGRQPKEEEPRSHGGTEA